MCETRCPLRLRRVFSVDEARPCAHQIFTSSAQWQRSVAGAPQLCQPAGAALVCPHQDSACVSQPSARAARQHKHHLPMALTGEHRPAPPQPRCTHGWHTRARSARSLPHEVPFPPANRVPCLTLAGRYEWTRNASKPKGRTVREEIGELQSASHVHLQDVTRAPLSSIAFGGQQWRYVGLFLCRVP